MTILATHENVRREVVKYMNVYEMEVVIMDV